MNRGNQNSSMDHNEGRLPFLLLPAAKDYLWGGSRLNDDFQFNIPISPFAEAWVCSTHPDGPAFLSGVGCSLSEMLALHPEYLGTHASSVAGGALPVLIKLIDAKRDLSVQVHPGDEYAGRTENSLGKAEMWYVLDARPESEIVYGFNRDVDEKTVRSALENGTIENHLNHVLVHKGDLFFIEPGTVHAVGKGCLIAEIQENSNITYRLYDYNRTDRAGRARPLHVEKALDVMKMSSSASPRQPMRVLRYQRGCACELLTRCKYFQVERLLLNTQTHRKLVGFQTLENSFHVLLCVDGCGSISSADGYALNFFKGDCVFVPAESVPLKLHGKAEILNVSC